MRRLRIALALLALAASPFAARAQEAALPDAAATLGYIHKSWNELSRSMTDCHSLKDIKVTTHPVLYLPAELAVPEAAKNLAASCGVEVIALPKRIAQLGDLMPEELAADKIVPGLLYLPNRQSARRS